MNGFDGEDLKRGKSEGLRLLPPIGMRRAEGRQGNFVVRSARFRREREASWRRLEELLGRSQRQGQGSLTTAELLELPHLYRSTLASLSVARSYVFDQNLVRYLDALAARAHALVFSPSERLVPALVRLVAQDIPRSARHLWTSIALSGLILLLGLLVGRAIVLERPDLFDSLVPQSLAAGRNPFASTEYLRESLAGQALSVSEFQSFAFQLLQNNVLVSLLVIGFGLAFGVPSILLLFHNGVLIGAMLAVFELRGLGSEFIAWLSIHGTTELLAIVLAGGAGLSIARAFMFPEHGQSRLTSAATVGPHVARLTLAVLGLLLIASFLEGYVRSLVGTTGSRSAIGVTFAAFWTLYFSRFGWVPTDGK